MKDNKINYELVRTKEESPSLRVFSGEKNFLIHSGFYPSKESDILKEFFNPAKYNALIVLGAGLGYHLIPLEKMLADYKLIVVIDIIKNIEDEISRNRLTSFLTGSDKIKFITGRSIEYIGEFLFKEVDFDVISGINIAEHPVSSRVFDYYYSPIKDILIKIINRKAGSKAAKRAFGPLYFRNILKNLAVIPGQKPVNKIFGKFAKYPGLVITSGPSLEKSIEAIRNNQQRLFIIAVDSAAPVLMSNNIHPDFMVSVDPQPYVSEHLSGLDSSSLINVRSISSSPKIVEGPSGFISLNSHPLSQLISEAFPGSIGSIDSLTGSVAGDAVCLGLRMGLEPLGLAGFDFSFSDYKIYAGGTSYQERYAKFFNSRLSSVETLNFNYIMKSSKGTRHSGKFTRKSFIQYKESMEDFIGRWGRGKIINIKKDGLDINGILNTSIERFLESIKGCRVIDKRAAIVKAMAGIRELGAIIDFSRLRGLLRDDEIFGELLENSIENISMIKKRRMSGLRDKI